MNDMEINFDRLVRDAYAPSATMEHKDALWAAAFRLEHWHFIARGELPDIKPYVATNPSVGDGKPMVKAFTDTEKLIRFSTENGLGGASTPILSIPVAGAASFVENLALSIFGIHFNADLQSHGFMAPLKHVSAIRRHLVDRGLLGQT